MEPNAEKNIQRKIQEAETTEVLWNKELVWSAVDKPFGKSRALSFYYVAASFILAITMFIFSTERTKQKALAVQLAELELAIEKQRALPGSTLTEKSFVASLDDCNEKKSVSTIRKSKRQIPVINEIPNIQREVTTLSPLITAVNVPIQKEEIVNESSTLSISASENVLPNQTSETVAAIIGTEWKSLASKPSKDRKLHIRLFQSEEETYKGTSDPVNILAHINQH